MVVTGRPAAHDHLMKNKKINVASPNFTHSQYESFSIVYDCSKAAQ